MRGRTKKLSVVCWFLVALVNVPAHAAKLKPETAAAFDRHIRATEARMDDDVRHNKFLIVDGLPELHGYNLLIVLCFALARASSD